jgi:exopolyphosphatase/guanosine-5'-triphosphate,3'-diphosphate pyrophosphatase
MNGRVEGRKVVGFVDLGTNSVRLLVVRLNDNGSYTVMSQEKEMVRLGEGEFRDRMITHEAMERTVTVCRKFADLARTYGAEEIIAVATSAARDARNQRELLERLEHEAGLPTSVVSGKEEARLIFLGVSSGVHIGAKRCLFIDIGGGSTEIILGGQEDYGYLDSLDIGAIRMTALFLPEGHRGAIKGEARDKMRKHVRSAIIRTRQKVLEGRVQIAVASSGTAVNLQEIAARAFPKESLPGRLKLGHLRKVLDKMSSMTLAERRRMPGITPERADIIVAGGTILETLMDQFSVQEAVVSERGLRDGLLIDYLMRHDLYGSEGGVGVRMRSVLQLGRSCSFDEEHARHVSELSCALFDSGKEVGLHKLSDADRELLLHAAMLHDIGDFISFNDHHMHSHYIIRNAELLGFDQREVAIMADLARFHRKKLPRRRDLEMDVLDEEGQEVVVLLSGLLRLAESLDRSHRRLVRTAVFRKGKKGRVLLRIEADDDCQMESWGVESDKKAFERTFGKELEQEIVLSS